jgi:hypothetical protein
MGFVVNPDTPVGWTFYPKPIVDMESLVAVVGTVEALGNAGGAIAPG